MMNPSRDEERERFERTEISDPELERLRDLHDLDLLNGEPEEIYEHIVAHVAQACQVPIAAFSLVDVERQWFKAHVGLGETDIERRGSFCNHAIRTRDFFMVEDAWLDERFRDHPLVAAEPGLRFYAAQVIRGLRGHPIGTLCVFDNKPRHLKEEQIQQLKDSAHKIEETFAARAAPSPTESSRHLARSILASIQCNCDWLTEQLPDIDTREALSDIQGATHALEEILDEVFIEETLDKDTSDEETLDEDTEVEAPKFDPLAETIEAPD